MVDPLCCRFKYDGRCREPVKKSRLDWRTQASVQADSASYSPSGRCTGPDAIQRDWWRRTDAQFQQWVAVAAAARMREEDAAILSRYTTPVHRN